MTKSRFQTDLKGVFAIRISAECEIPVRTDAIAQMQAEVDECVSNLEMH